MPRLRMGRARPLAPGAQMVCIICDDIEYSQRCMLRLWTELAHTLVGQSDR